MKLWDPQNDIALSRSLTWAELQNNKNYLFSSCSRLVKNGQSGNVDDAFCDMNSLVVTWAQ